MAKNFNFQDCELLANLIDKYKEVVESKKTNAYSNFQKDQAWKNIEAEFNAVCSGAKRNVVQLKNKFKHMKHEAQKKLSSDKLKIFTTGGGSVELESTPLHEKIKAMNVLIQPTDFVIHDSDMVYHRNTAISLSGESESINNEEVQEEETVDTPLSENNTAIEQNVTVPSTPINPPTLIKRGKFTRGLKRKPNSSIQASEAIQESASSRQRCFEMESELKRKHLEEEHALMLKNRTEEHALMLKIKTEEHALRTRVLSEKLLYYQNLNKSASMSEK